MGRKKRQKLTATFTSDFAHEFHAETGALLRTRLIWFIAIRGVFLLTGVAMKWLGFAFGGESGGFWAGVSQGVRAEPIGSASIHASLVVLYALSLLYVIQGRRRRADLLRLSQWLIFLEGTVWLAGRFVFATESGTVLLWIMLIHVVASLFFPWTAMQAMRPMFGVLVLNAVGLVLETSLGKGVSWGESITAIVLSPLVALPGGLICAFRHSRRLESFRFRHVLDRYGDLRRELTDARRIHEGLFPQPMERGDIRFAYLYQPMRQIGGDYLFANVKRDENGRMAAFSVVLTDVTGHGIAAALTVNRLHGELERVFAEDPDVGPGDVLGLLNRYVHLTLARHSVYMTAFCVRVKPDEGVMEFASGGHPPAFVKAVNGTVEQLQSTSFVLGACRAEDFDPGQRSLPFGPGDALIAYTDGATEARGADGRMLGIAGIQRLVAASGPRYEQGWAEHLLRAVDDFRDGPPADDTLVVEIVHAGRPGRETRAVELTQEPEQAEQTVER